ncbi:TetR/AcrR family transcriptional regulator [Niveibacterium terrae]|uniref:TetR/AcrR family transcriptional regulator n=1 Tax=Niveibacterium terrae TaxID=3373598 RepID=UPI003A8EDE27
MSDKPQEQKETETCRADARRIQVLDAASACFRRHGFHGTSMAELSRAAGMSVGHIYHYFANKEAIIAAIVERDNQRAIEIGREIEQRSLDSGDRFAAMIEMIDRGVIDEVLDDPNAALLIEIAAEAARNEKIAAIIRSEQENHMSCSREMLISAYHTADKAFDPKLLESQANILDALFSGLALQGLRNPNMDRDTLAVVLRAALKGILEV